MARVPIAQNVVDLRPVTDAKVKTQDYGAGYAGDGLRQAGKALGQFAEDQDRIQTVYDEAGAKKLDNLRAQRYQEVLWGENGFYKQQGFNAENARKSTEEALAKVNSELLGEAKTPRMKAMFAGIADQHLLREREGVSRWSDGQLREESTRQSTARQVIQAQDAVTFFDDPERRETSIQTGLGELRSRAATQGWAPEALDVAERDYRSGIYAGAVSRAMVDDPEAAKSILDAYRDQISPEQEMALDKQLHGPLMDRQAVGDVDSLLGATPTQGPSAPAGSTVGIASKIIGAESGGNPNARNPVAGQTASGLGQFTDATWLGLYKQRFGGDLTDRQILGLKTDPVIGRKMTEFAVQEHTKLLDRAGLPVTEGNVYLAHFLGPKAVNVLRADPRTPVAQILPASWIAANKSVLEGKTAGQVTDWTARKMGGKTAVVSPSAGPVDVDATHARIDATDWGFERKQAAHQEADRRYSRQEAATRRQEAAAYDEAWTTANTLGDGYTAVSQLGASFTRMSPQQQRTMTELAKHNSAPKPIPDNPDLYYKLATVAGSDPAAFAKMDLRPYATKMPGGDFQHFANLQAGILKGGAKDPKAVSYGVIWSSSKTAFEAAGFKTGSKADKDDKAAQVQFMSRMLTEVDAFTAQNKKAPTPDEIDGIRDRLLLNVDVVTPGKLWGTRKEAKPVFQTAPTDRARVDVPTAIEARIVESYKRTHGGAAPDATTIGQTYIRHKGSLW